MKKKKIYGLLFLSFIVFFIILINISFVISDGDSAGLSDKELTTIRTLLNNPFIKILTGNTEGSLESFKTAYGDAYDKMPLGDLGVVIIHVVFWIMLLFAFSDIFGTFLPFTNKFVPWVLGAGLTIITANLGFIPYFLLWIAKWTAWAGAFGIFIGMLIAFVAFVAVAFFGNKLKVTLLKSKIAAAAAPGAAETATAIRNLRDIEKSME